MCILSWLSDTPAFNISYEAKGLECYKYLGVPEYSIDYNNETQDALDRMEDFFRTVDERREEVIAEVQNIHQEVRLDLEKFLKELDS